MCGATVQSMNHIKALTETQFNTTSGEVEIVDVTETRVTGFTIHAMITATLLLLPMLKYVPIPVVSGVFLFLGRKLMSWKFLFPAREGFIRGKVTTGRRPPYLYTRKKENELVHSFTDCLSCRSMDIQAECNDSNILSQCHWTANGHPRFRPSENFQ